MMKAPRCRRIGHGRRGCPRTARETFGRAFRRGRRPAPARCPASVGAAAMPKGTAWPEQKRSGTVRFGPDPTRPDAGRRPPPNYLSRSMQTRLLLLFASLACVLFLMREARNPDRWAWMWAGVVPGGASAESEVLDTRLRPPPAADTELWGLSAGQGRGPAKTSCCSPNPTAAIRSSAARRRRLVAQVLAGLERADRVRLDRVLKAAASLRR